MFPYYFVLSLPMYFHICAYSWYIISYIHTSMLIDVSIYVSVVVAEIGFHYVCACTRVFLTGELENTRSQQVGRDIFDPVK